MLSLISSAFQVLIVYGGNDSQYWTSCIPIVISDIERDHRQGAAGRGGGEVSLTFTCASEW